MIGFYNIIISIRNFFQNNLIFYNIDFFFLINIFKIYIYSIKKGGDDLDLDINYFKLFYCRSYKKQFYYLLVQNKEYCKLYDNDSIKKYLD